MPRRFGIIRLAVTVLLVVALSVTLFLGTTSRNTNRRVHFSLADGVNLILSAQSGTLSITVFDWHGARPWANQMITVPGDSWRAYPPGPRQHLGRLGFGHQHDPVLFVMDPTPASGVQVFGAATATLRGDLYLASGVHLVVLLSLCLAAFWVRPLVTRSGRSRSGLCPTCGYDLRASRDRCPECGTAVSSDRGTDPGSPAPSPPCLPGRTRR